MLNCLNLHSKLNLQTTTQPGPFHFDYYEDVSIAKQYLVQHIVKMISLRPFYGS